ncbi:hypothetical protein D3C85_1650100 [compost metagenome]
MGVRDFREKPIVEIDLNKHKLVRLVCIDRRLQLRNIPAKLLQTRHIGKLLQQGVFRTNVLMELLVRTGQIV